MIESAALAGLFSSAFLSATLLPGNSEAALAAVIAFYPQQTVAALFVATLGNTLGGMTSYVIGCFFSKKVKRPIPAMIHRYGVWALLLSWLPVIGDVLCVASGFVRHAWWQAATLMAIGKMARYLAVIAGWQALMAAQF
jgi:Predicted membrane protein